jgi:hypothetical protein
MYLTSHQLEVAVKCVKEGMDRNEGTNTFLGGSDYDKSETSVIKIGLMMNGCLPYNQKKCLLAIVSGRC